MEKSCQKFLCDQMLIRLGKWIRAAGYDTVIIEESLPDSEILERAIKEGRILLTRDRHFLEMIRGEGVVLFLESNTVDDCAFELKEKLMIDWTLKPFSRCLLCNEELIRVEKLWTCASCDKLYWEGSHTKRMLAKLKKWNR